MIWTDNPIADFMNWDAEQERKLAKLPVCADCDEHIQDEYCYEINGEYICEECLSNYRKCTEDCCI